LQQSRSRDNGNAAHFFEVDHVSFVAPQQAISLRLAGTIDPQLIVWVGGGSCQENWQIKIAGLPNRTQPAC